MANPISGFYGHSTPLSGVHAMGTPHHAMGHNVVQPTAGRESTPRDALGGGAAAAARARLNMSEYGHSAAPSPAAVESPLVVGTMPTYTAPDAAFGGVSTGHHQQYHRAWRPQSAFDTIASAVPPPLLMVPSPLHMHAGLPVTSTVGLSRGLDDHGAASSSPSRHAQYYTSPLRDQGVSPRTVPDDVTGATQEESTPGRVKATHQ